MREDDMKKRPISITAIASAYLMTGTVGFAVHFREILARQAFQYDDALIELTELIAIAWIIHPVSSQKRKDALKGMMNTGFAHPAFPFGASIA